MSLLDIFKIKKFKQDIDKLTKENSELNKIKYTVDQLKYLDIKKEINTLTSKKDEINKEIDNIKNDEIKYKNQINTLKKSIIVLKDEELLQSFGFYEPKYNLMDSEKYKVRLSEIRDKQKIMVKNKTAVNYYDEWTLNDSKVEGRKMNNDNIKLIIRSFNNECDASIIKIKFNNIDSIEKKIKKAFEVLNKLGKRMKISITHDYLNLKIEELYLAYEYEIKKQEEKEEQRRIKEQIREEQKVLKEIESMKQKIEKEEKHFKQAIEELSLKCENASEEDKLKYKEKMKELQTQLEALEKDKEDVYNREQNTRAGYVYVISNIGSFGENVYKIGMTRRLEPTDRVKELSGTSVPFSFDIHAMIFSEDAPKLESKLHEVFRNNEVNKINHRKEFFKVSLEEIEKIVKEEFDKPVEFTKLAQAEEYRQSLVLENTLTI
ncbi:DUF4041 domain-containing protein [Clostridium botulinum]|nr:DUF4041 domain-containing protein [Clostridium botulinum]